MPSRARHYGQTRGWSVQGRSGFVADGKLRHPGHHEAGPAPSREESGRGKQNEEHPKRISITIWLYGTIWIMVPAYVGQFAPQASRAVALVQSLILLAVVVAGQALQRERA